LKPGKFTKFLGFTAFRGWEFFVERLSHWKVGHTAKGFKKGKFLNPGGGFAQRAPTHGGVYKRGEKNPLVDHKRSTLFKTPEVSPQAPKFWAQKFFGPPF